MRRMRTKKYLAGLRSEVIRAERRVTNAKKDLDFRRQFWRREWLEYDKETAALKRARQ